MVGIRFNDTQSFFKNHPGEFAKNIFTKLVFKWEKKGFLIIFS